MSTIIMTSDQDEHYNRIDYISCSHTSIVDTTTAGGGKTIFPLVFSHRKNIKTIIILCPGTLHQKHWKTHVDLYGIKNVIILTYDQLRGSKKPEKVGDRLSLSHGLLYRHYDNVYEPTEKFKRDVEEGGLLIVCDEFHLIKNDDCGKTIAVKTLTKYLAIRNMTPPYPPSRSFLYFSSMTPFDDPDHVINFGYLSGVIRSDSLFSKEYNMWTGLLELYQYCNYFDPMRTATIWGTSEIRVENAKDIAYRLLTDVYLRNVSSFVKDCHKNFLSKQSIYYSYFDISPLGVELMKRSLAMIKGKPKAHQDVNNSNKFLQEALLQQQRMVMNNFTERGINVPVILPVVNNDKTCSIPEQLVQNEFMKITTNPRVDLNNRTGVMYGTMTSQTVKTYYAVLEFIEHVFRSVKNVKVIVFLNYIESVDIIMKFLPHLGPIAITGDHACTEQVRNNIVEKFQRPNLDSKLLLIMSQIGSDGIELDDTDGNYPRVSIGLPDFYNSRYFQCPGRTFRRFTKSNSLFFFIMINSDECLEESLDKSINNKSKVMIETLRNNEIIAPMDFEKIYNPNKMDINSMIINAGQYKKNNENSISKITVPIIKIKSCSVIKSFI